MAHFNMNLHHLFFHPHGTTLDNDMYNSQCPVFVQLLRVGSLHSLMSANQVENIIMNAHNIYIYIYIVL